MVDPLTATELPPTLVPSSSIPQANHLGKVRQLVDLTQGGKTSPPGLRRTLGLDARHVAYYRRAAETLGLLRQDKNGPLQTTDAGRALSQTSPRSAAERAALLAAIRAAPALRTFWSYLDGTENLSSAALARRISDVSGLGQSTAARRAQCLEQWRGFLTGSEAEQEVPPLLEELPARIRIVLERSTGVLRHGIEHYNAFNCTVRNLVVIQHIDHSLELLLKCRLAVAGRPEVMEQEEYDITRCVNVLAEMPQFRATMKRPPLLALLHRQRNLVQHTGEAVSDDLLTLLVASGVKLYLEWARLFFGVELDDLFPNRHSLALPNFDIDVRAVQERYIAKLRGAAKLKQRLPKDEVRSALYVTAALDPQLSDEEKEALFTNRPPLTPHGQAIADRLSRVSGTSRAQHYEDLAEFLATSPALKVVSKSAGAKGGAVPVYSAPKDPNAVPVSAPLTEFVLGDARSVLSAELATWRTARAEQRFDFISVYSLVRLYRSRNDPALSSLGTDEIEALALSSMRWGMPFWAWLARMEADRTLGWAKRTLSECTDYELLKPLGSIVVFGTGESFRTSLEKHLKDRRRTISKTFREFVALHSANDKLQRIRDANTLYHPSELPDIVAESDDPRLDLSIRVGAEDHTLRALLQRGEEGLETLRSAFPKQDPGPAVNTVKWMCQIRSSVAVEFALDHVGSRDHHVRPPCRTLLRKFDLVAYCPFVAR